MPRLPRLPLLAAALMFLAVSAQAAKVTECTKIDVCYCINDELKATILAKVDRFRQTIADQRKAGKAVAYLSVPLTSAFGGNFNVNMDVAAAAKAALEKRYGAEYLYVLNPGTKEADLPKGTGTDYMLMWTLLLEGTDGFGEFDVAYFAGPQDFARFFGFDGNNDMAKLDAFFDKRRKDSKYGTPGQIPIVFDGMGVAPPHGETSLSEGYVGKCPL